ncbi:YbfB/YjiJ family MFS transporter [Cupriavidus basilensis]
MSSADRQLVSAIAPASTQPGVWAVALAGLAALAVAMGIGRFAFTPLLPMMLHDGSVTLGEGGWLATLNYLGYFAGAAACLFIRPDPARMVRCGLVATVLLTLGMAAPGGMGGLGAVARRGRRGQRAGHGLRLGLVHAPAGRTGQGHRWAA